MSTFIDLDSIFRDREVYPNEASYEVSENQVETWFKSSRSVRAHPQNPNTQPLEFATSIKIHYLATPYTEELADVPRLYVNFRSILYKDIHLIHAIDGRQPDAKFICSFEKIQNDSNGDPLWIHWKCSMEQVMRFRRGEPIFFEITTRSGTVIPQQDTDVPDDPDPTKQTLCTFETLPYIRDGDYDNHLVDPHVTG